MEFVVMDFKSNSFGKLDRSDAVGRLRFVMKQAVEGRYKSVSPVLLSRLINDGVNSQGSLRRFVVYQFLTQLNALFVDKGFDYELELVSETDSELIFKDRTSGTVSILKA